MATVARVATVAAVLAAGCTRSQMASGLLERPGTLGDTLARSGDIGLEPPPPQLRQVNLPSGLRLGFEAAPTRGMVGVVLVVGQGSTADRPGKEGLAHLVEHLGFHARFEGRPISEALARLGATYNADTTPDRTSYHMFAPARALPALLRIVAQLLAQPLEGVDRHAVAVEREIVENELRQRTENAVYGQVAAWIQSAMFPPDHPYARPVAGTVASLRALSLDDARAFVRQPGYGPHNATLLVMGEFDPAAAAASAERDLPPALVGDRQHPVAPVLSPPQPPPRYLPPPPAAGFATTAAPVAWPEIWICYFLADLYGPYAPVMKVLTTDVVERTLRQRLIDDPDVGDVDLQTLTFRQATVLACRITLLSPERRLEIADKARAVIASLWGAPYAGNVSATLSWDATRMALAEAILEAEPFTGRALARAEFFHMTGALNAYDALIGAVAGLRPELVAQHGVVLLGAERARLLFVEPLADDARPRPGAVGVATLASRRLPDAPSRGVDFGDPPPTPPARELGGTQDFVLSNGMRVLLVRRPQFPSVTAALGFAGGAGASPPGILELLRLLERDGTFELRQNAMEIQKADGPDVTADMVVTGRRNLSNALVMLALRLRALDRVHWVRVMDELQHSRTPDHETAAKKAGRAFWQALYGAHPYGRVMRVADLRRLRADDLAAWLPQMYNPANATLVVAGDIDVRATADLVTGWFGDWRGVEGAHRLAVPAVPAPQITARPVDDVIITHRPVATQVEVTLGCRLPGRGDMASLATARMLAAVVVGQLRATLREEGGAAYSVSGSASVLKGGGAHLLVNATIDNRRVREALGVIRGYWSHFARGEFDTGSLSQARWDLVEAENLAYQTSAESALRVLDAVNRGWTPANLLALPDAYRAVTPADLARAFATCSTSTVTSLLGDEPTIRAALK